MREGWMPGQVIDHYISSDRLPPGQKAPYQIRLDDGNVIFAPADDNRCIRPVGYISDDEDEEDEDADTAE